METDLPALCRRVWGKVPEAIASNCLDINGETVWIGKPTPSEKTDAIQAACLRWLLEQDYLYIYPPGPSKEYCVGPDSEADWSAADPCLTTCLLLAVERCHEYKAAEAARGEK